MDIVSLYVCDFPPSLKNADFKAAFAKYAGFLDARVSRDKTGQKICFVDFNSLSHAEEACRKMQGFKFMDCPKGITLRISDKTRNRLRSQDVRQKQASPVKPAYQSTYEPAGKSYEPPILGQQAYAPPPSYQPPSQPPYMMSDPRLYQQQLSPPSSLTATSDASQYGPSLDHLDTSALIQQSQMAFSMADKESFDPSSLAGGVSGQHLSNLINTMIQRVKQTQAKCQEGEFHKNSGLDQQLQVQIQNLKKVLDNIKKGEGVDLQGALPPLPNAPMSNPYGQPQPYQPPAPVYPMDQQSVPPQPGRPGMVGGEELETLLQSAKRLALDLHTKFLNSESLNGLTIIPTNHGVKQATSTIYVEGLPADATEREVCHIFRPFEGFQQLRLVPRNIKEGKKVHFAFADFQTKSQATMVINTLQGYRFHRDDIVGLQFGYATRSGDRSRSDGRNRKRDRQRQRSRSYRD